MNTGRNKILVVTRNFPPLIGGMEKLIFHLVNELTHEFDVKLIGPTGCEQFAGKYTLSTFPHAPLGRFLINCLGKTLKAVKSYKPHLILSGSGMTVPAALFAGKLFSVPVLSYLHGLDIVAPNRLYQLLFPPMIKSCKALIVNSSYTATLAENMGITDSKINILNPGTTISSFPREPISERGFRQTINAGGRPILLSVGRLTKRKGILEFIDNCMGDLIATIPDILLVIIGGEANDAISPSFGLHEKIINLVTSRGYNRNIIMLGRVNDDILRQAYASSDVLIFPVLECIGDVEGFGMVAIEAAAHGLPTVAFAAGGVVDAVKDGISGRLIEKGNYSEFSQAAISLIQEKNASITSAKCKKFAENFSWTVFGDKISDICRSQISRNGSHR